MLTAFVATYVAVFIAEIVGDKLLYTSGILATRFRWGPVIGGMGLAFMAKMAVAVAVGATIGQLLPTWAVAVLTAAGFIGVAWSMWRQPVAAAAPSRDERPLKGAFVTFYTIFLAEWCDKGMLTAGAMSATYVSSQVAVGAGRPMVALLVWAAAVLAMVTKGGLAVALGTQARRWIAAHVAPKHVRYAVVLALVVLGVLSVLEVVGILED